MGVIGYITVRLRGVGAASTTQRAGVRWCDRRCGVSGYITIRLRGLEVRWSVGVGGLEQHTVGCGEVTGVWGY